MARRLSSIAPDWWDYTTLDEGIIRDAAQLSMADLEQLSRPGFKVVMYDTLEDFYLAEALEYIHSWRQSSADNPVGICGPIGPTEQLPLVARLVNELEIDLSSAHFWGMDEWLGSDGREVDVSHPLSFERADRELCFDRIAAHLKIPEENLHFPAADTTAYAASWEGVRCAVMQGGQGDIKHWAFNDPPRREGRYTDAPPAPEEYRNLGTRIVELHPITLAQNARTSGGGNITITADDGTGAENATAAETFVLTVNAVNDTPVADNSFVCRQTPYSLPPNSLYFAAKFLYAQPTNSMISFPP